jgi:phospholipid/cholesterol/gamma-HCH transport system substrate-binding protein
MKRRDEVMVGVLLTVAVIVALLGTLWLARGGLSSGYPLYTRFAWGQNLKQGQPVLLAGMNVGYVADVKLRQEGYLDVQLSIGDDYGIPRTSKATVKPVGIFGDVAIALTPEGPSTNYFQAGDTVPAGLPAADIGQIMSRVDSIGRSVQLLTGALEAEFVKQGGFRDIRRTLANTEALTRQLSSIAEQQNRNLNATFASVRRATGAIDSAAIDSTLRNLRQTSANVTAMTAELNASSTQLRGILTRLDRGEGTAGKLLTDTLLYSDVRRLMVRLDSLTADFKKNPRKYINLEIF